MELDEDVKAELESLQDMLEMQEEEVDRLINEKQSADLACAQLAKTLDKQQKKRERMRRKLEKFKEDHPEVVIDDD